MRINRQTKKDMGVIKNYSTKKILASISEKTDAYWSREQKKKSLQLFYEAVKRVPAYKKFLKQNKIDLKKITSYKDLQSVPATTKDNYLRKYSLEDLSWDGVINGSNKDSLVFTSTSGSTGEPFYFSRNSSVDQQSAAIHELFFRNSHLPSNSPTLVIVCFGMGVWIGGIITYQAFEIIGHGEYPISIITPGINKEEIFKTLKQLAPHFKQIILAGYPPFIKDIIDEAPSNGVNLKKLNVRLLFAAEAFTESFREHLVKKTGVHNILLDTMNIYGSADIGTMAFETPLSILIRRIALKNLKVFESIFSNIDKTPTLAQYIPSHISFEAPNNEILLTGNSSIPLIKYSIGDYGGVFTFNQMKDIFESHGIDLYKEAKKAGISKQLNQLPFMYVYERMDSSVKFYGAIIWPETIREVLQSETFENTLTGKFTMLTKFDDKLNQVLEINAELSKEATESPALSQNVQNLIVKNLLKKNAEYSNNHSMMSDKVIPKIVFWPYESPNYFKPGGKQKWVDK